MTTVNFGTCAFATAMTSFAPSRAMPPASYSLPTMKPVMFWRKTSGTLRLHASSMKCAPFCADSAKRTPLLARMPTGKPSIRAQPQTSVSPYSALNSSRRDAVDDARDQLARVDLVAEVLGDEAVQLGRVRERAAPAGRRPTVTVARTCRGGSRRSAARSRARARPTSRSGRRRRCCRVWTSAPPSSSAVTSWPVAAFTSGGPPMKIVPVPRTMIVSSLIAGTYAPPAVHEPITTAICGMPARGHLRLVEEDPPEVLAVREDLGLQRQERAARVDEVQARQLVLLGDLLRAQVLLDRQREVRAALHRRVVRDDHALPALDDADARDDARARAPARRRGPTRRARSARGTPSRDRPAGRSARARSACRARGDARLPARRRRARPARCARAAPRRAAAIRSCRAAKASSRCACDVRTATR